MSQTCKVEVVFEYNEFEQKITIKSIKYGKTTRRNHISIELASEIIS